MGAEVRGLASWAAIGVWARGPQAPPNPSLSPSTSAEFRTSLALNCPRLQAGPVVRLRRHQRERPLASSSSLAAQRYVTGGKGGRQAGHHRQLDHLGRPTHRRRPSFREFTWSRTMDGQRFSLPTALAARRTGRTSLMGAQCPASRLTHAQRGRQAAAAGGARRRGCGMVAMRCMVGPFSDCTGSHPQQTCSSRDRSRTPTAGSSSGCWW
jgi:hypothetical protein